jgi:serine/threonine protein kinase
MIIKQLQFSLQNVILCDTLKAQFATMTSIINLYTPALSANLHKKEPVMASLIGKKTDRYEILSLLGEGGMATVYKAFDTRLEREVAVKVIRRGAFPPEQLDMILARFEREAKSLGRLSHPNIVSVIDYGEYEGAPYLVMVYLPGGTLKEKLGKPIPWRDAIQTLLPVAHALEYVHERNIINRDVKPSNILMTDKGQPMLTDFGLVKLFEGRESSLTASGAGIGTPDYMAPEQWTGEATAQSDMYSLGVVLYEMVTGYRPYVSDTPAGVLLKQANDPLPLPNQYVPDLPQNVESVLLKVLARKPADRYPDMHTFVGELQSLLEGKSPIAATIKTEQLRERMTGKIKKQEIEETRRQIEEIQKTQIAHVPPVQALQPVKRKSNLPVIIAVVGGIALLVLCGGCWFLYSLGSAVPSTPTPGISSSDVSKTAVVVPQTLPAATDLPLPSPSASPAPTDTPLPTATSMPEEISDSQNTLMRLIPGGEFTMGSNDGLPESRPEKLINVETFYMDKFEVSNEAYAVCVNDGKCRRPKQPASKTRKSYYSDPNFANYPVINVDWKMANTYCEWRGARLPTEAEWEKAARGTDGRKFPWGNGNFKCELANHSGCVGDTAPVYQYDEGQSPYGVYGMSGNVWEWTSSLFKIYPYVPTDGRESSDAPGSRILRGGSWYFFGAEGSVYTYTRFKVDPSVYNMYIGFRCAVTK